jgi:hypothetical protein
MRKTWWLLAVVLLAAYAPVSRAEGEKKEAVKEVAASEVKEAKADSGADYVIPVNGKEELPPAACSSCAPKTGIICAAPERCRCGRGADCCHRLWAWLTYRPLKKPCLWDCCHKCNNCHTPPLYLYLLDPYHACGAGPDCPGYSPAPVACATCGRHP